MIRPKFREHTMAQFYFSSKLDHDRTLCLAPLSDRLLASCGDDAPVDSSGYFLFERRGDGHLVEIEIIARVDSDEAAVKLSEMIGLR